MDTSPADINNETPLLTSKDDQVAKLESTIAELQRDKAKLEQQMRDSELELQATVDEFLRSDNERQRLVNDIDEFIRVDLERQRLIKELQAAKRLAEENSRLKSEFLSTMSHELRTPMNAIEGFTSIMLSRMGGVEFNAKAERYITRVNVNSKRLLQLINDFLDLSRVESGRLELAYQPFAPVDLAQRWQTEIGILAEKKISASNSDWIPSCLRPSTVTRKPSPKLRLICWAMPLNSPSREKFLYH